MIQPSSVEQFKKKHYGDLDGVQMYLILWGASITVKILLNASIVDAGKRSAV